MWQAYSGLVALGNPLSLSCNMGTIILILQGGDCKGSIRIVPMQRFAHLQSVIVMGMIEMKASPTEFLPDVQSIEAKELYQKKGWQLHTGLTHS